LNYFKALPDQGQAVITARYGPEVWESEHRVFDVFVTRATLPLQYVFADHWLCDVFVVDEATRQTLQRLWLTVLIDAYSRSVLGMALLNEPPSTESILSALQHAIWPKTSHTELGLTEPWICYGIPAQLFLDNAWAHLAGSLENLARVIGHQGRYATIDLDFRPPYRGRYGGLIERLFGNLSAQVKQFLPGALQSSQPRQVQNAARQACLVYQDLDRFCQRAIVTYQHTPHRELGGMTPHQKWLEGLQATLPLVPPLTEALRRQFWRLYPETRRIAQKGVSLFGMHYWSPELNRAQRVQLNGQPVRYGVHYDPADIRRIALFRDDDWVGDVWAKELRLPDGSYRSLSLWEQSLAKEIAGDRQVAARDWKAYLDELDALSQQRWTERVKARRTAKRSAAPAAPAPNAAEIERATEELTPEAADSAMTVLLASFAQSSA
jgi:putative transposase